MRAVVVREFGGPEQLRLAEVADLAPGPGQAPGDRARGGVNPVDAGNRADGRWAGLSAPCILSYDIAGVISGTGPGVGGLAPGDRVMAMTHFPDGAGGYAEQAVVDARLAASHRHHDFVHRRRGRPACREAHRILESRHAGGKIILDVAGS